MGLRLIGLLYTSALLAAQSFEYDAAGRLIEVRYSDGKGIAYIHDEAGNLTGVTPLVLPPAPSALHISAAETFQQVLSWTDNASTESGYRVERRPAGRYTWEILAELPADSTSYLDPLNSYAVDFRYRVSALAPGDLQSAFSGEVDMVRREEAYFAGATDRGQNWIDDPTFGLLYTASFPWVYSPDHGWWYFSGTNRDSLFVYDLSLGWLWTRDSLYPYLYAFSLQSYLFYARTPGSLRYFYDFELEAYRAVPQSKP